LFVGEPKANQFLETSSDHEEIPGGAKREGEKKNNKNLQS